MVGYGLDLPEKQPYLLNQYRFASAPVFHNNLLHEPLKQRDMKKGIVPHEKTCYFEGEY